MSPSLRCVPCVVAVLAASVLAVAVHASDRPKLPRGDEVAEQPDFTEGIRLAPLTPLTRQGRSPYWPLRHPALDARKRHRTPEFQHPNVRFVNNHYFNDLGGGPFVGGDDSWEEPKPLLDYRARDRNAINIDKMKAMTAEELIQALQEKQWASKDDVDGSPAMALRFGSVGKK